MPTTEAGKRLLAKVNAEPPIGMLLPEDIDAIEAEARSVCECGATEHDDLEGRLRVAERANDALPTVVDAAVAAERDRIVREVREVSLFYPSGEPVAPEHVVTAVLAIVRGKKP